MKILAAMSHVMASASALLLGLAVIVTASSAYADDPIGPPTEQPAPVQGALTRVAPVPPPVPDARAVAAAITACASSDGNLGAGRSRPEVGHWSTSVLLVILRGKNS